MLLGTEEQRTLIKNFENFLSKNIFQNQQVTLIPKYKEDILHIKIGNENQIPIYELGDGLQTLICILLPIYLNKEEQCITVIEEPESHLHPHWQLLLLKSLKQFKNHQYFISTHSSSFLNDSDVSLYHISRKEGKSFVNYINKDSEKINILNELGYKPSDLFQTNYVLWVEGETDKMYIKNWVSQLCPELIEGEHYSILFYSGSAYKHYLIDNGEINLDFIKSINQNFGIVMDSDRESQRANYKPEKKRIEEIFLENGFYCWHTKYREIENYIPYDSFHKEASSILGTSEIEIPK